MNEEQKQRHIELVESGKKILCEMSDIQQLVDGIPFSHKSTRKYKHELLIARWNECCEKLEKVQEEMSKLESTNDSND